MAKVRILSDRVANQIAAGEVIERPAAVVKELLENALDAGATRVSIEFAHAGRALIRVEDNGEGMSGEDARTALLRHATSKIADAGDLDRLSTFGFRGEALPSVASVSRLTMSTRAAGEESGTEIAVNAGRILHERACGRPVGTRVDVEHLFEPVPARRKFLKTDRTESGHIINCVRLYALACPSVSFALLEDGREIFRSPECTSLRDRVSEIFGSQVSEGLIALDCAEHGTRLTGLIGRPGLGRGTRHDMMAFVNSRPVDSRTVNGALIESYREYLAPGRFPVAFLFLHCNPAEVDVNVHPAKREIRFRNEAAIRTFIIRSILSTLDGGTVHAASIHGAVPFTQALNDHAPLPAPFQGWVGEGVESSAVSAQPQVNMPSEPASTGRPETLGWRYLGAAHGSYCLFETSRGLVLLDRRSAHERIWYERLKAQFIMGGVPVQRLLLPLSLELNPVASAMLADHLRFFHDHGMEISEFGRNFFRIEALPAWMEPGDAEAFIRDLLGALREGRMPTSNVELARDELARLAASKAVRLTQRIDETLSLALVRALFETSSPNFGPDGRPTFVEFNHGELARRFQK